MTQFSCEDDCTRCIIDQGQPGGLTARIDLQTQRMNLWVLGHGFQDDRKRVAAKNSRFFLREQQARPPWMDRVQRFPVGINDKNVRHRCSFQSLWFPR
jgi:hypothetical protein